MDNIKIVEVETTQRDCRGCWYSVQRSGQECPVKCCLSTVDNAPIIYKRVKEE